MMNQLPSAGDIEVNVVSFADGKDPNLIRTHRGRPVDIDVDCVLLHSRNPLPTSFFPSPSLSHSPPNDQPTTYKPYPVCLLAYNGVPDMTKQYMSFPFTPKQILNKAFLDLYPDHLSFCTGDTGAAWNVNVIQHRVSSHNGASGGGLFDLDGNLIGLCLR